jgi:putative ABC transport system permease protein
MTLRDWRAGELTMLLLALVLAVAALASVAFLADRMRLGLERDARQMIGADLVVRADHPVDPEFVAQARALDLSLADTAIFPSMASAGGKARPLTRLAALKAVSAGYPLRGVVRLAGAPGQPDRAANGIPAPGTVWVDPTLLESLKVRVGDPIRLGSRSFKIAAVISRELDRGFAFINFSPRVMLRADDLPSTGLIGYGSRVTYRLLLAGPPRAVTQFGDWARERMAGGKLRGVALESLEDGQPQVRQTLERARHFLTLVAMLTALLAAVAIAMAAHRFSRRHLDGCAVMRCFGASKHTLQTLFTLEFLFVGLAGSALGVALGYAGHALLLVWLGGLIQVTLPPSSGWPVLQGMATGLVLLLGFALPPLVPLTRVPPARVLRREWGAQGRTAWAGYALGIALFAALLVVAAGELKLGGIVAGGFAAGLLVFGIVARGALWALWRAQRGRHGSGTRSLGIGWHYALASLERRGTQSALQITALAIGLMCLLLLAMTRNDLIAGWRQSTPPDGPDHFIIDIQPDQRLPVEQFFAANGQALAQVAPMIRGRLVSIDGKPLDPDRYADEQTRRLVEREFNLSYADILPSDNRVVDGRWYGTAASGRSSESRAAAPLAPQISIEQGLAKRLDIKPGTRLRFDVAGQQVEAPVTSIRKLDWGSFRVNFFVLMPPGALRDFPATFVTSFHLAPGRQDMIDALVSQFPNLTVIDTGAILAQLQQVLDQVTSAVQFLFVFTLAAGILVLYAALAGTRDERIRESALLRALGASHRQVRSVQVTEFVLVGGLAGFLAAVGAQLVGTVLATQVFDFHLQFNPWLPLAGIAAGVACAGFGGWLGLRRALRQPVLKTLRDA